jgi:hypothetical protein
LRFALESRTPLGIARDRFRQDLQRTIRPSRRSDPD